MTGANRAHSRAQPRILGIIPARGGSKTIPRKNVVPVAGNPLITYTFEAARGSRRLDRVILSTDDEEIAAIGRTAGIEVPFQRPLEFASDTSTVESVIDHALAWLVQHEGYTPDAFVLLPPTTPLRTAQHIDGAIALFESSGVDGVVGVSPPMEHPCDMVRFDGTRMRFMLTGQGYEAGRQRQHYPGCYFVNGAVYVTKTEAFRRTGSRFGETTVLYLMEALDSIDIDTTADLVIAELLLQRRQAIATRSNVLAGHADA